MSPLTTSKKQLQLNLVNSRTIINWTEGNLHLQFHGCLEDCCSTNPNLFTRSGWVCYLLSNIVIKVVISRPCWTLKIEQMSLHLIWRGFATTVLWFELQIQLKNQEVMVIPNIELPCSHWSQLIQLFFFFKTALGIFESSENWKLKTRFDLRKGHLQNRNISKDRNRKTVCCLRLNVLQADSFSIKI
jgi:hypothetical protein